MGKDHIKIEWDGLEALRTELDGMYKTFRKELVTEYNKLGLYGEAGSRALAPRDEGDLEQSITASRASLSRGAVSVSVGTNLHYAAKQHEMPQGYMPGPRTRAKPGWKGYPAGRKYIENMARAVEPVHDQMLINLLDRFTGGDGL